MAGNATQRCDRPGGRSETAAAMIQTANCQVKLALARVRPVAAAVADATPRKRSRVAIAVKKYSHLTQTLGTRALF